MVALAGLRPTATTTKTSIVALFVEDDETIAPVLELVTRWANKFLADCRLEFHRAASVDEGVEQVGRLLPDICVVDRLLPGGDGLEVADMARRTHARVAMLSSFSIKELGGRPQRGLAIEEMRKHPRTLRRPLRDKLVAMARGQAEAIERRRRRNLPGRVYSIGIVEHVAGADRVTYANGGVTPLTDIEREILGFFGTYPRALMSLQDLQARLRPPAVLQSSLLDVAVEGLNDKLRGFARVEWTPAGYRMSARISLRRFTWEP